MVKLASALPKEYEANGLESNSRHLLARYSSQEVTPVVALVRTKDVHHTEDFERVPRVEVVHIEAAFNEDDADAVRSLLVSLHDDRVKAQKQPLDFGDATDNEVVVDESLELEAADADVVDAEVVDDDAQYALTGKDN